MMVHATLNTVAEMGLAALLASLMLSHRSDRKRKVFEVMKHEAVALGGLVV